MYVAAPQLKPLLAQDIQCYPTSYLFSRKHHVMAGNFQQIQFSRIGDLYLFVGFISLTSAIMPIMHCTIIIHGLIANTLKVEPSKIPTIHT